MWVAVIQHVDIVAIGAQGQGAEAAGQARAEHTRGEPMADPDHAQGFAEAIHIAVVGEHVAGGVGAEDGIEDAAGFDGEIAVVDRHGRVVGALDGDIQGGPVLAAIGVDHGVAEGIGQAVADAQLLHLGHAVVQAVEITAIGIERQPAIGATQFHAQGAGSTSACFGTGAQRGDGTGFAVIVGRQVGGDFAAVHIVVVVQHIADRVEAGHVVVQPAGFDGRFSVVGRHRVVVLATDQHDDLGAVGLRVRVDAIADGVGEALEQQVAGLAQGLHIGIEVVYRIGIGAVGVDGQGAIQADHRGAAGHHRHGCAGRGAGVGLDKGHGQRVAVRVERRRRGIAARVDTGRAVGHAAGFGGQGHHNLRHGWVVDAAHGDHQLRDVGQAFGINHPVGEDFAQGLVGLQALDGRVGAVDVVEERAVGADVQGAEEPVDHGAVCLGCARIDGNQGAAIIDEVLLRGGDDAIDLQLAAGAVGAVHVHVNAIAWRRHRGLVDGAGPAGEEDDVAGGVAFLGVAIGRSGLGRGLVIAGHRVVEGALDDDAQLGDIAQAGHVAEAVAEELDQLVAGSQPLDRGVAVVDHIGITAVGIDGQGAVGAIEAGRGAGRDVGEVSRHRLTQPANAHHGPLLAIGGGVHIGIVGQHIAGGIATGGGVEHTAGFDRRAIVIDAHGRVVRTPQGDGQGRVVDGAGQVRNHIAELFHELLAGQAQGLHQGIVVIDHVLVGAVGAQDQLTIQASDYGDAIGRQLNLRARVTAGRNDPQSVGIGGDVHVGVVGQDIAGRVDPDHVVKGAACFHRDGGVGHGDRVVVHGGEDDLQAVQVGQRIGRRAWRTIAAGIAEVAQVIAEHGQGIAAVEVGIAQVQQVGQRQVDIGQGAAQ
ncbi:hypothetical protein D3C76_460460 [compost metagenome]